MDLISRSDLGLVLGFRMSVITALVALCAGCSPGASVPTRPKSYVYFRFEATTPQQQDFTCGAASLATIIDFYWGGKLTESDALATLKQRYSEDQIKKLGETGLSFDDLIFMANQLGYAAEGAKVPLDQLPKLAGPMIVHLNKGVLQHFVALRRFGDHVYYVSDPVVGELAMSEGEFASQYTGNALAVYRSGAPLPRHALLDNPRDGVRVGDSLRGVINAPGLSAYAHF